MNLSYRPEIDGFRALAVSLVVLFHAEVPGFSHGFVGVDIFFVISGFLITSIIAREQAEACFSYGQFVLRRVRRILPALVVVMLVCIPFSWTLMLPDPLENFGQSLIATIFSANNILLWLTTGYWDLASDYKPLLHTWSLGVEEQFYIFYPFLLLLALRLPLQACHLLLAGLALSSFGLMVWALERDPAAGFYLLHYRAWQLLIGGIAGLLVTRSGWSGRPALAGVGLGMILVSLVPTDLPMAATLGLATLGSASYLLWARAGSPVTWIFTRRPVIFVGLVSYSFYLWHQPVFAFLRVALWEHPTPAMFTAGIALAFGLAVLSWRYVEIPFRTPRNTSNIVFWTFTGGGQALVFALGAVFYVTNGLPGRLVYADGQAAAGMSVAYNERIRRLLPRDIPTGTGHPAVLVAGNSFARDFSNVLLEAKLGDSLTLLYRDDLSLCSSRWTFEERELVARLDLLIFASGNYRTSCLQEILPAAAALDLPVFFIGTKHFGDNLNPLMRLAPAERAAVRLRVPEEIRSLNDQQSAQLGPLYIDLLSVLSEDGGHTIRVTNSDGVLLTTDRVHLSQAGAITLAEHLPGQFSELYPLAKFKASVILED